jgi:hypothetical protein
VVWTTAIVAPREPQARRLVHQRNALGPHVGVEYFHELSVRLQVGLSCGTSIRLGIDIETTGEAATALARRPV